MADSDGKCGGRGFSLNMEMMILFASFSNYGDPIDMVAPGVGLYLRTVTENMHN